MLHCHHALTVPESPTQDPQQLWVCCRVAWLLTYGHRSDADVDFHVDANADIGTGSFYHLILDDAHSMFHGYDVDRGFVLARHCTGWLSVHWICIQVSAL